MPNELSHLALANHNQELLAELIPKIDKFPDWVATVAFYKALHVVEAVFASETPVRHGVDHPNRERCLKADKRYTHIYRHYRPLYAASMVARYMQDGHTSFADYMNPQTVIQTLLNHDLHQLETSAKKQLKHPQDLVTITK